MTSAIGWISQTVKRAPRSVRTCSTMAVKAGLDVVLADAVTFPRDEGWHRLLPGRIANPSLSDMEWVYLNAHVQKQGGAGRRVHRPRVVLRRRLAAAAHQTWLAGIPAKAWLGASGAAA